MFANVTMAVIKQKYSLQCSSSKVNSLNIFLHLRPQQLAFAKRVFPIPRLVRTRIRTNKQVSKNSSKKRKNLTRLQKWLILVLPRSSATAPANRLPKNRGMVFAFLSPWFSLLRVACFWTMHVCDDFSVTSRLFSAQRDRITANVFEKCSTCAVWGYYKCNCLFFSLDRLSVLCLLVNWSGSFRPFSEFSNTIRIRFCQASDRRGLDNADWSQSTDLAVSGIRRWVTKKIKQLSSRLKK